MSKQLVDGEQVADYAWLKRTQRCWRVWIGNPFCVSLVRVPLDGRTRERVVESIQIAQRFERARFAQEFPDVAWVSMARAEVEE